MPPSSLQPSISEVQTAPSRNLTLPPAALAALWQGHRMEAIKLLRLEQNIELHEAKDVIDTYVQSQPTLKNRIDETQANAREGLLRWLIFLLIGGAGLTYVLT
jgi:ribosomal protein L7/L12